MQDPEAKPPREHPAQLPFRFLHRVSPGLRFVLVPAMLFLASTLMALAWLGHLKFEDSPFLLAMLACWLLVLPEYFLNITALRFGYATYSGAQMAAFRLCSGVVCIVIVSRFVLGETIHPRQLVGFGLMLVSMLLIASSRDVEDEASDADESTADLPDGVST